MAGIKADKWITRKSARPSWRVIYQNGTTEYLNGRYDTEELEHFLAASELDPSQIRVERVRADEILTDWKPMIEPFISNQVTNKRGKDVEVWDGIAPTHDKVISYGVSSYGYDVRVANEFKVFTNVHGGRVDPKNFDVRNYVEMSGSELVIPPNGFALARTVEYFRIPRNVLVVCLGKSTYARCGIIVNVTPLEPEWEGHVTLEFSNTTNLPAVVYADEGVAQMLFFESDEDCAESYADKGGKYQGQTGVTDARMPK